MFARTISSVEISSPDERAVHEFPEKIVKAGLRAETLNWTIINEADDGCHQCKVTRRNSNSSSSTSTIIEYFGTLFFILTSREFWITVHHCAKKKKTSIICVANLHSLPWNITSKVHKIQTTLNRRRIFNRASENRCLHDAGKSRQQQSHVNTSEDEVQLQRRKAPSKGQNLDYDSWMTYVEKILFETIIVKYVYFDTMMDGTVKKREQN